MAGFVKGDIVVIYFPFSDGNLSVKRPALVLANLPGEDIVMCQITKRDYSDYGAIPIGINDFVNGGLRLDSFIRPSKIFTLVKSDISGHCGKLNDQVINNVVQSIIDMLL